MASPAVAKGTSTVTVKGPGVARPISLDGEGTAQLNEAAGLYRAVFHEPGSVVVSRRPNGKLGPRYVATYGWLVAQDRTKPVRQELYPFADGGAWTLHPAGAAGLHDRGAIPGRVVSRRTTRSPTCSSRSACPRRAGRQQRDQRS